ncbi:AEC family transporter [Streptomyces sp. NPDC019396]|uniref:AEC family transporter n=1 Tax=Streptomyces sp. NPDC019396 TaxID=3154687 RepID=UPI0033F17165
MLIVNALVPIFFALGLGYGAGKRALFDHQQVMGLNKFTMSFAIPAALAAAFLANSRAAIITRHQQLLVFLIVVLVTYALAYALFRVAFHLTVAESSFVTMAVSVGAYAPIGLPLANNLYGPIGQLGVALSLLVAVVTVIPLSLALVERDLARSSRDGTTPRARQAIRAALSKPVVWAPLLGLCYTLVVPVPLPHFAVLSLQVIGVAAGGSALFLTGLILAENKQVIDRVVFTGIGIKNLFQPLLTVGLLYVLGARTSSADETLLLMALPCGVFPVIFAFTYKMNPARLASTTLFSTVFGIVTLTAVLLFEGSFLSWGL